MNHAFIAITLYDFPQKMPDFDKLLTLFTLLSQAQEYLSIIKQSKTCHGSI